MDLKSTEYIDIQYDKNKISLVLVDKDYKIRKEKTPYVYLYQNGPVEENNLFKRKSDNS